MFGHFTTLCMKGLGWKMVNGLDLFTKIVNNWKSLTILVRISILDAWQGSEYVPEGLQKQEPVYSHVQFAKMNYNDKIKIRILTHFVLWDFYPWRNCIWRLTYTPANYFRCNSPTSGKCSVSIPPENIRRPLVFCCFEGVQSGTLLEMD